MGNPSVQPAHGCGEAPVDLIHLSRQTMGNRSLEREILSLFATQSVNCVERLQSADNLDEHKTIVHTLKGSALGIGAWHVVDAAKAVEEAERNGKASCDDSQSQDRAAALVREVAVANAYICSLLSDS